MAGNIIEEPQSQQQQQQQQQAPPPQHLLKSTPSKRRGFFSKQQRNVSEADLDFLTKEMVDSLSEDEKEHAARSSFAYLWKAVRYSGEKSELKEERDRYARYMAMRHLKSKKGNVDEAMVKFRNAIRFRKEQDLDGLRLCFHCKDLKLDDETHERYAMYRERLEKRMQSGRVFVQGTDKNNRAIYTIFAARTKDFSEPEWFMKESLYNFERALACTERASEGQEEGITVIGNYTGFTSKHAAPMSMSNEFMDVLRQNYPGRVDRVFLLNTPMSFMFFWSILKPFIGTETRKKILFLSSDKQREAEFSGRVSLDQATPWMLQNGKRDREFDANEYLNQTPFDYGFADC